MTSSTQAFDRRSDCEGCWGCRRNDDVTLPRFSWGSAALVLEGGDAEDDLEGGAVYDYGADGGEVEVGGDVVVLVAFVALELSDLGVVGVVDVGAGHGVGV